MTKEFIAGDNLSFLKNIRQTAKKTEAQQRSQNFAEIYETMTNEELQIQSDRCLDCGNPYCEWKCPLHNYIPNWLGLVSQKKFDKSAELMHATNPFPEICGRVCPQDRLCEQACTLNTGFGAVTIGSVEKNIADEAIKNHWRPDLSLVKKLHRKVAVIGAGPAGLGCAELLIRNGVSVDVYDKYPEIGGLLTFGIPNFKLDKKIISRRRKYLEDLGICFHLNTEIGKHRLLDDLKQDYDSVFLGTGTYKAVDGGLIDSEVNGVVQSLDYLIGNINQQQGFAMPDFPYHDFQGKDVVVLGGGDTAMDCVRSAIRQKAASVTCVYRKTESDMPGSRSEVQNAKEEGVKFIYNLQPTAITSVEGCVSGIEFVRTDFDELVYENKEVKIDTEIVIIAFGFRAGDNAGLQDSGIETNDSGLVKTQNTHTTVPGIYAGGDMVSGADLVVTAIAQGRDAARQILMSFI